MQSTIHCQVFGTSEQQEKNMLFSFSKQRTTIVISSVSLSVFLFPLPWFRQASLTKNQHPFLWRNRRTKWGSGRQAQLFISVWSGTDFGQPPERRMSVLHIVEAGWDLPLNDFVWHINNLWIFSSSPRWCKYKSSKTQIVSLLLFFYPSIMHLTCLWNYSEIKYHRVGLGRAGWCRAGIGIWRLQFLHDTLGFWSNGPFAAAAA